MAGTRFGMMSIIFGVLLLVVGLVLSDIIIDNVNKQGGRLGCYDGNEVPIRNAQGPTLGTSTTSSAVPNKVSASYPGTAVIGQSCGGGTATVAQTAGASATTFGTATCTGSPCGTIRYTLEVYGADSLNNLFTLVYWIVLVGISLASIGAGGLSVARARVA